MRVSTTTRRRTTTTIKEYGCKSLITCNSGKVFLCAIDRPVCTKVPTIFCSIREPKHDGLFSTSSLKVIAISRNLVQRLHHYRSIREIFNRFKEWYNVKTQFVVFTHHQFG